MQEAYVIDLSIKAMYLTLILSMPPIIVATIVGLGVSLLQALTQVQEQTIGYAVKLVVTVFALVFTATWVGDELYNYTVYLFNQFPYLVR